MDIFRAVMHAKEYSPRVLKLTEELLDLNPASYTVWYVCFTSIASLNIRKPGSSGNIEERA